MQGDNHEALISTSLLASDVNFINPVADTFECTAKFRYRQKDVPVTVKVTGEDQIEVSYESASAVTPVRLLFYTTETQLLAVPQLIKYSAMVKHWSILRNV